MAEDAGGVIERLQQEHDELREHLLVTQRVTWASRVDDQFAKALLLAVASYFEARMTGCVVEIFEEATEGADALVSFVQSKAVERRYHDWFAWNARNANRFFTAFGDDFKQVMEAKFKRDPEFAEAVIAFLELGNLRNELVHENYATFAMPKTSDEVFAQYRAAMRFVDGFADDLRQHMASQPINGVC